MAQLKVEDVYDALNERLKKQGYHLVGNHSSVKKCFWNHAAITEHRFCYKCKFYGIESHRCIQLSVSNHWCWNACTHCWRLRPQDVGLEWNETVMPYNDDPKFIMDNAIKEYRRIMSGYKGRPGTDLKMYEEAMNPKHVAISLTGEPTLYPRLGELIKEIHNRGMSSFLVTRGIRPDVLGNLEEEPSQIYISLEAWDKESYNLFNKPLVPRGWELTLETLEMLPSFSSTTVYRITLVKGFNDTDEAVKGFARLIKLGMPSYIEVKAFMYVGASKIRLTKDNMPSYNYVKEIANKISEESGYPMVSESIPSRIVLLSNLEKPVRYGNGCPMGWSHKEDNKPGEYEVCDEDCS
ncbi:MAG: 4-demethylwyosine synthase TYW1 [Caldisphaera sp.]|jgi:tRNA wybutosine-synthesizing protein 1|nr:4-demethylwyosine synthase TYW1 [Caldisphaera sp.]PMP88045.1 MAG: 4-demethylwyosine synthase TYW1 [Caldisphaera sp.]